VVVVTVVVVVVVQAADGAEATEMPASGTHAVPTPRLHVATLVGR
jgi:hypothetical protein